jgi:hypothetical protein
LTDEERQQEEFNRKADKTSGWLADGCIGGCLPTVALMLVPLVILVL